MFSKRIFSLSSHLLKSQNPFGTMMKGLNSMDEQEIISNDLTPYITQITFNRPSALNALNLKMIRKLISLTNEWNISEKKIIWLSGIGGKAFCAGGDIKSLYDAKISKNPEDMKICDHFFREEYICDYGISKMKSFQISAYDGIVMGGGVGVSIYSKAKIATETSLFAMPEAKIGLFTDVSASYFLSRLPNNLGVYLGLTGARLKGVELVQAGIANYYIKKDNLSKLKEELIEKVNKETKDEEIREIIKKYEEKYEKELPNTSIINELFKGKTLNEIYDNLANDNKNKDFSEKILKILYEQSPLSLRIIFEAIKRGKNLTLEECFKMEFRIVQRFMEGTEFFEGVRCTLIDKKDKPVWKHKSPFDVTDKEIESYFASLPKELELKLN